MKCFKTLEKPRKHQHANEVTDLAQSRNTWQQNLLEANKLNAVMLTTLKK